MGNDCGVWVTDCGLFDEKYPEKVASQINVAYSCGGFLFYSPNPSNPFSFYWLR